MKFPTIGSILILTIGLSGCASVDRLPPPQDRGVLATIPGIPYARFWGDVEPTGSRARSEFFIEQLKTDPDFSSRADVNVLAISGGGQKGAYGAGLLAGWTTSGTRPQFRMVTGISTGSLIAPFAFLGPGYDDALRDLYTRYSTKDVSKRRLLNGLFSGDSVIDNSPLREIIKKYFTEKEMNKIAKEYNKGRRLYIGTTHLDAQRPVIWDIGAISASGHPDAYELIIDIMMASAAIPGAFPPTYFKVEIDGKPYDELHVDGGVTAQIFIGPRHYDLKAALKNHGLKGNVNLYLIRNNQLSPTAEHVRPKTFPILSQSLETLLRSQGNGDMYQLFLTAKMRGMDYHAAFIPNSVRSEPEEAFDIAYMKELFELGYQEGASNYKWLSKPPAQIESEYGR